MQLVNEGVQWITGLWNDIVVTVMGPMIATVKNIVTMVLQQVVNTVIQPILNGQNTTLSALFGGVSVDTIASYGPSVFANITATINSESSLLGNVGSTMGSMMSSLSVFSGAGTILGPLISMAGPGIMVTVMSMIASVVMSTVLTPLFSNFTSTVLQDDLNTLMAPLGGTSTGALAMLDNIASLMSVTSQPGVTSQNSGSGYIAQSTGSSVGTTGTSNSLSSLGSSGTCNITAIGTCLASVFNDTLLLGKAALDNSNGTFSVFNTVIGELFTAMETLTGSSSVSSPATSAVAPTTSTIATSESPADYAHMLGILAVVKDILGIAKTQISDLDGLVAIQFFRTYFDIVQFFMSIEYWMDYSSSVIPFLWFLKSGTSLSTNVLGLLNDVNNVGAQSWASSISNAFSMTFETVTFAFRAVVQLLGGIVFYLAFTSYKSSIPTTQLNNANNFMIAYVGQKIVKFLLFLVRFTGIENSYVTDLDIIFYGISAGLNVYQMFVG